MAYSEGVDKEDLHPDILAAIADSTPLPSERFYRLLDNAPWNTVHSKPQNLGVLLIRGFRRSRTAFALAGFVLGIILLTLARPPVASWAQELLNNFKRTSDETIKIATQNSSDDGILAGLSLEEVMIIAEFEILAAEHIPYPFGFKEASFDPVRGAVTLVYSANGRILNVIERTTSFLSESDPTYMISPNAAVEKVTIRGFEGELVRGIWEITEVEGTSGDVEGQWTSEVSVRILRWKEENIYFEIFNAGGSPGRPGYMELEELAQFAEGLKPVPDINK